MSGEAHLSRRAVLLSAVAAVVTACRPRRSSGAGLPARGASAHAAARASAYEIELALVATYAEAMSTAGPTAQALIAPLRDDHRRHLDALGRVGGPATALRPRSSRELAVSERTSASALARAAAAAPDGETSALLASIAASHRAHLVQLTDKPFRW